MKLQPLTIKLGNVVCFASIYGSQALENKGDTVQVGFYIFYMKFGTFWGLCNSYNTVHKIKAHINGI